MTSRGIVNSFIIGLSVIGILLIALGFQSQRLKVRDATIEKFKIELNKQLEVNWVSQNTIKALQAERTKNAKLCAKRIALKDETINEIDKIRNLQGGANDQTSNQSSLEPKPGVETGNSAACPDDICDTLNRMWVNKNNSTD